MQEINSERGFIDQHLIRIAPDILTSLNEPLKNNKKIYV